MSTAPALVQIKNHSSQDTLRRARANELVFAVVGHIGSGTSTIGVQLESALQQVGYDVHYIKASEAILAWATQNNHLTSPLPNGSLATVSQLQDWGDEMRRGNAAEVARQLIRAIRNKRANGQQQSVLSTNAPIVPDGTKRAYILDSIRHPAEIHLLRNVYHNAFTLIGVVCDADERQRRLTKKYSDAGDRKAQDLMQRDAKDSLPNGQRVSDSFHLSDIFLDNTVARTVLDGASSKPNKHWDIPDQLARLVKIITRLEIVRPTIEEHAMYVAAGAQLRSACMSRQVGAALLDRNGNVISSGTNEAPQPGGGVYGQGSVGQPDHRCAYLDGEAKRCSNTHTQNEIIQDLIAQISALLSAREIETQNDGFGDRLDKVLRRSRIGGLLEFSRAVHAEMDAVLSAARQGNSPIGTRVFVTTFPCHYCARHLVAAGVDEVQYIEPYPKSQALTLHSDSITTDRVNWTSPDKYKSLSEKERKEISFPKVLFRPFTGVAPRLYERIFLKDRPLKNDKTGALQIGEPEWGHSLDIFRIGYPELEAELCSEEG